MAVASHTTGTVDFWLKGEHGYGFIRPEDGGEEVFVHHTGIAARSEARVLSARGFG